VTVPYATEEQLGPDDGYTNSSVRATTNYTVFTGSVDRNVELLRAQQVFQNLEEPGQTGRVDVPESAIYEGDTVTVEMDPISEDAVPNATENGTDDGNTTENETTGGNSTDGNTSDGDTADGNDADNETSAALGERAIVA